MSNKRQEIKELFEKNGYNELYSLINDSDRTIGVKDATKLGPYETKNNIQLRLSPEQLKDQCLNTSFFKHFERGNVRINLTNSIKRAEKVEAKAVIDTLKPEVTDINKGTGGQLNADLFDFGYSKVVNPVNDHIMSGTGTGKSINQFKNDEDPNIDNVSRTTDVGVGPLNADLLNFNPEAIKELPEAGEETGDKKEIDSEEDKKTEESEEGKVIGEDAKIEVNDENAKTEEVKTEVNDEGVKTEVKGSTPAPTNPGSRRRGNNKSNTEESKA